MRQPAYLVALFGAVTGYGVMILSMTATPLAMLHHDHGLGSASTVIQLHVLGMFLPSFFTGSLIARFGVLKVMGAGIALLVGHVLMTLSGTGTAQEMATERIGRQLLTESGFDIGAVDGIWGPSLSSRDVPVAGGARLASDGSAPPDLLG